MRLDDDVKGLSHTFYRNLMPVSFSDLSQNWRAETELDPLLLYLCLLGRAFPDAFCCILIKISKSMSLPDFAPKCSQHDFFGIPSKHPCYGVGF